MTLGIPSEFSFQNSTVTDITTTLDDLLQNGQSPLFHNGLELREDDWIYEYTGDVDFTPQTWSTDAGTEYFLDQIIFKDGATRFPSIYNIAGVTIYDSGYGVAVRQIDAFRSFQELTGELARVSQSLADREVMEDGGEGKKNSTR